MHVVSDELCHVILSAIRYDDTWETRNKLALSVLVYKALGTDNPSGLDGLERRYVDKKSLRIVAVMWGCSVETVRNKLNYLEKFLKSHEAFIRMGVIAGGAVPAGYLHDLCVEFGLAVSPTQYEFSREFRAFSIETLGLSNGARNAIQRFGIYTLGDLVDLVKSSSNWNYNIRSIGDLYKGEVEYKLKKTFSNVLVSSEVDDDALLNVTRNRAVSKLSTLLTKTCATQNVDKLSYIEQCASKCLLGLASMYGEE